MSVDDDLFAPIGSGTDIVLPDIWLTVVKRICNQAGWASAALAGGALRDLDNGRPIKDVDIFVPFLGDNQEANNRLQDVVQGFHEPGLCEIEHNVHNVSQVGKDGISHFMFVQDGWKFEISQKIETFDHRTLLDSFDIGLCMISLDTLSGKIYRTDEYKYDVKNKLITIVQKTGGRELMHAERIASKYSGWTIVPL